VEQRQSTDECKEDQPEREGIDHGATQDFIHLAVAQCANRVECDRNDGKKLGCNDDPRRLGFGHLGENRDHVQNGQGRCQRKEHDEYALGASPFEVFRVPNGFGLRVGIPGSAETEQERGQGRSSDIAGGVEQDRNEELLQREGTDVALDGSSQNTGQ